MLLTEDTVASLIERFPAADDPGKESKFTGPDPDVAAAIVEPILTGGAASISALIDLIRDAVGGGAENYKPGYALHCIAVAVGRPGRERERRMFAAATASRLGGDTPSRDVQAFLIRQLQVAGGEEVADVLGKLLADDALCEFATQALIAIGAGAPARLLAALANARGGRRVTILQALGALREPSAAVALHAAVGDDDAGVRLAAAWGVARVGDASMAAAVIAAADRAEGWERIQLTKACLLFAENLAAAGNRSAAGDVYSHLRDTRTDPSERYIREAAALGLARIRA